MVAVGDSLFSCLQINAGRLKSAILATTITAATIPLYRPLSRAGTRTMSRGGVLACAWLLCCTLACAPPGAGADFGEEVAYEDRGLEAVDLAAVQQLGEEGADPEEARSMEDLLHWAICA